MFLPIGPAGTRKLFGRPRMLPAVLAAGVLSSVVPYALERGWRAEVTMHDDTMAAGARSATDQCALLDVSRCGIDLREKATDGSHVVHPRRRPAVGRGRTEAIARIGS